MDLRGGGWGQEEVGPSAQGQRSKGGGGTWAEPREAGTRLCGGGCREACANGEQGRCRVGGSPPTAPWPRRRGQGDQKDPGTAIFLS